MSVTLGKEEKINQQYTCVVHKYGLNSTIEVAMYYLEEENQRAEN